MSVSDPLLRELKACTAKLLEDFAKDGSLLDESLSLHPFCETLELIFLRGLHDNYALRKAEAWYWLENIASPRFETAFSYGLAVRNVKENVKVVTHRGRFRLLVRTCLVQGCLHIPVEKLIHMKPTNNNTYIPGSILGDEILGEIFLSVLLQCSKIKFQLQLCNAAFLDETWQLGCYRKLEIVPCKSLGICVGFVHGKAIVVRVEPGSVAGEDEKVQVGDIVDEINGHAIIAIMRGKLGNIMRQAAGKPVTLFIIKANYEDGMKYAPLRKLHTKLSLDSQTSQCNESKPIIGSEHKAGFSVDFVGEVAIGKQGDVAQIAGAIMKCEPKTRKPVQLEILEMGVKVIDRSNNKTILRNSYMEISSCGRYERMPKLFAYIAGNCTCNMASEFTCYVFHSEHEDQIVNILHSIAQGFQRTHWAV